MMADQQGALGVSETAQTMDGPDRIPPPIREEAVLQIQLGFEVSGTTLSHTDLKLAEQP